MAARIKENAILKSADIETKEFLKPISKVAVFVNTSQRISLNRYNFFLKSELTYGHHLKY